MKYTAATLSALAAVVAAQPRFTNTAFNVVEGEPFTLTFEGCTTGCTIILQNGPEDNLQDVETLATDATESLTVELGSRPEDEYNFKIVDNDTDEENYSVQFSYGSEAPQDDETTTSASASSTSAPTTTAETTTVETTASAEETTTVTSAETTETTEAPTTTAESTTLSTASSTTATTTSAEATETNAIPESGAGRLASPLALVAGAVVAMAYLN